MVLAGAGDLTVLNDGIGGDEVRTLHSSESLSSISTGGGGKYPEYCSL